MADLTISQPYLSFGAAPDWHWTLSSVTANSITYANNSSQKITLSGTFNATGDFSISGTIDQVNLTQGGAQVFKITGLSLDAGTLANLVANSTDSRPAFAYLLGGNDTIIGSAGGDELYGYGGDDTIIGGGGNDILYGGTGNNTLEGGAGNDTVRYSGKFADYKIERTGVDGVLTSYSITDLKGGGTDRLHSVENVVFSDKLFMTVDVHGSSGQIVRLYQAAFDRMPDAPGMNFWEYQMEQGSRLDTIADQFVKSAEFKTLYGTGLSNGELVGEFYQHILHRTGEKAGVDFWTGMLDSHKMTTAQVLAAISDSPENVQLSVDIIGKGLVLDLPIMT